MSKERALAKMLKEMAEPHSGTTDVIHNWLCDQTHDAELMAGICQESKSIAGAMKYCMQEAKKEAVDNSAMVEDKTVFSWVRTYFVTADIEVKPVAGKMTTKPQAKKKETVKEAEKTEKEPTAQSTEELEQMNLFDFYD